MGINEALERALISLGMTKAEAQFRLHDMIVEEVSMVDRAANKRRFLSVKNAGPGDAMTVPKDEKNPLRLAKGIKSMLLTVLGPILAATVDATELVKGAEETDVEPTDDYQLPSELQVIGKNADALRDLAIRFGSMPEGLTVHQKSMRQLGDVLFTLSKKEDLDAAALANISKVSLQMISVVVKNEAMANALAEISEVTFVMAQMAAAMEDGEEMPADMVEGLQAMAAKLLELAGDTGEEEEKEEGAPGEADDTKTADGEEGEGEEDDDFFKQEVGAILTSYGLIAKRGAKMSTKRKKQLREALKTLDGGIKQIMQLLDEVEDGAEKRAEAGKPKSPDDASNVGDQPDKPGGAKDDPVIGDVMKQIKSLSDKVNKMERAPMPPASAPTDPDSAPKKKGRRGGPWIM